MKTRSTATALLFLVGCTDVASDSDAGQALDSGFNAWDGAANGSDASKFDASGFDASGFDAGLPDASRGDAASPSDASARSDAGDAGPTGDAGTGGACTTSGGATGLSTLQVQGRSVTVYVPKNLPAGVSPPVILSMHGFGIGADQMPNITGFPALADREGLIAVFPSGDTGSWNTGKATCGLGSLIGTSGDDIAYLSAVLDAVAKTHCIDRTRVFATGFSMGGYSANYLACKRPDMFRAAAAHSGGSPTEACADAAIPVMVLHGTNDGTISYDCGTGAHDLWLKHNACSTAAADVETVAVKGGECVYNRSCKAGSQVALCSFKGMGHGWAGSTDLLSGGGDAYESATELLWKFFKPYR